MTLSRLTEITNKSPRIVIGLNSGTSMDGVDALCAEVSGAGVDIKATPLKFRITPYPDRLRQRLLLAPDLSLEDAAHLHVELGRFFARCAIQVALDAGLRIEDVDLIGSHGQTLYHHGSRTDAREAATWQAADLDVISEVTGVVTVGDFRARDVAAGGNGAPLMPYLDWVLFRTRPRTITLNLGGVAALTAVDENLENCRAFDSGPANLPLDILAARATKGAETYDPGGRLAASGTVDPILMERLMAHPFLVTALPRSAGREIFGMAYVEDILAKNTHLSLHDILATTCAFVARSIVRAVKEDLRVDGGPREIVVSGGGLQNLTLMRQLKQLFSPVPLTSAAEYGVHPDAKEALLFAVLANERLFGSPTNVPGATGARWPVSLGKVAF